MDQINLIDKEVNIVAYYFRSSARRLRCFPKRMEYNGRRIVFTETGISRPVQQQDEEKHIFDMTDGSADYRLEFNPTTLSWKLVAITKPRQEPVFRQLAAAL
jgi:hypothetical protein